MGLWASLANFQVRDLESPVQIRTDPPLRISSIVEFLVNNGVLVHFDRVLLSGVPELSTGNTLLHGVIGALSRGHTRGRIGYDEIFSRSADARRLGIETNISPPKSTAESYHVRGRTILVTPNPSAT